MADIEARFCADCLDKLDNQARCVVPIRFDRYSDAFIERGRRKVVCMDCSKWYEHDRSHYVHELILLRAGAWDLAI